MNIEDAIHGMGFVASNNFMGFTPDEMNAAIGAIDGLMSDDQNGKFCNSNIEKSSN